MANHDIVVIGASAGGVESLTKLVRQLPRTLPASVFIVQHMTPHRETSLPRILQRVSKLPVTLASDNLSIAKNKIFVAPPDKHLILENNHMKLFRGPKENHTRPSIDVLFRSAALTYADRVVGVVLSGILDDGTAGLKVIKDVGGVAIVQDPEEALHPDMPINAANGVKVDAVLPLTDIAAELTKLVNGGNKRKTKIKPKEKIDTRLTEKEIQMSKLTPQNIKEEGEYGTPSVFSCPDCRGVLWEIQDGNFVRFRCRTGHGYLPEVLSEEQSEVVESTLWAALTALEEKSSLSMRLAKKFTGFGDVIAADRFRSKSQDALEKAKILRQILMEEEPQ
jgi:two-component system, chemotaxis family, protein-glutamate methylesterase/glutaminase